MAPGRTIPNDWFPGTIPDNVDLDETAYVGTSYGFTRYRSEAPVGVRIGRGASLCDGSVCDVGPRGLVTLGDFALVALALVVCDEAIEIGDYAMLSWNVVVMDTYRVPLDPGERRRSLMRAARHEHPYIDMEAGTRPVRIGRYAWVGFEACVLPGVTIGEGSIVGARSVVAEDVPPYSLVAGNPARFIRRLEERA
jgi:acetyltransferase-like isoleucine patch superfamily enzyme